MTSFCFEINLLLHWVQTCCHESYPSWVFSHRYSPLLSLCSFPQVPQHHLLVPVCNVWWSSSVSLCRVVKLHPGKSHLEIRLSFIYWLNAILILRDIVYESICKILIKYLLFVYSFFNFEVLNRYKTFFKAQSHKPECLVIYLKKLLFSRFNCIWD